MLTDKPDSAHVRATRRRARNGGTMAEVASAAGVSIMSVSRALRAPEQVSPAIRARVAAAMEQTGYVPNALAGALASQRSRVVAVIVPFINASFADSLGGLTEVLEAAGYHTLIGYTGFSLDREERLVEAFLSRRVDGFVLTGNLHNPGTCSMLRRAGVPVVETWNLAEAPIDTICGFSNHSAARAMTDYLIGRGHRRIAYIGGIPAGNDRAADREAGFLAAMVAHGLAVPPSMRLHRELEFPQGRHALEELLERHPETEAVFAASDMLAVGAVFAALRRGVAVPDRLAVAGFDDADIASAMHPGLTTVRVPRDRMGREAATLLLRKLDGDVTTPRVVDLGFEIVVRQSA